MWHPAPFLSLNDLSLRSTSAGVRDHGGPKGRGETTALCRTRGDQVMGDMVWGQTAPAASTGYGT